MDNLNEINLPLYITLASPIGGLIVAIVTSFANILQSWLMARLENQKHERETVFKAALEDYKMGLEIMRHNANTGLSSEGQPFITYLIAFNNLSQIMKRKNVSKEKLEKLLDEHFKRLEVVESFVRKKSQKPK